jgi:hypothetical protein
MRTTAVWIVLASLLLWSCVGFRETTEPTPEQMTPTPERVITPTLETMDPAALERAKQDIYRVLASRACGSGVVYIYPEIARYPLEYQGGNPEDVMGQLREASRETWESYRVVNDPNQPVATFSDFPINCQYEFVSPTDVVCAGPITDCIIPHGYSDIAFNKAGTQALVYMYHDCSECGGGGDIYLLEKKGGGWTIINSLPLWVS